MSLTDAAVHLGCNVKTVARRIERGELTSWPGHGTRKVSTTHVQALVRAELDARKLAALLELPNSSEPVSEPAPEPEPGSQHEELDATNLALLQREVEQLRSALRALQQAHVTLTEQLSIHLD